MRRKITVAILASFVLCLHVFGQEPQAAPEETKAKGQRPSSKGGAKNEAKAEDGAAPAEKPEEKAAIILDGDKLYMKDGTILAGGQVVKQSPRGYEFAIIEGVDPILIPLRQVDHVEYDEINPAEERRRKALAPAPDPSNVIPLENLSAEFAQSLAKEIPEDALSATDVDFVPVLLSMTEKLGVRLVVEDAVRAMPSTDRRWTYSVPAQTTFSSLLGHAFIPKFPMIDVQYKVDEVVIAVKVAPTQSGAAEPEPDKGTP